LSLFGPGPVEQPPPGPVDRPPPGPVDFPPPGPVDRPPPGPVDSPPPGPVERPPSGPVDLPPPGPVESPLPGPVESPPPGPVERPPPGPVEHGPPGPVEPTHCAKVLADISPRARATIVRIRRFFIKAPYCVRVTPLTMTHDCGPRSPFCISTSELWRHDTQQTRQSSDCGPSLLAFTIV
jgi:hypothetical protein